MLQIYIYVHNMGECALFKLLITRFFNGLNALIPTLKRNYSYNIVYFKQRKNILVRKHFFKYIGIYISSLLILYQDDIKIPM